MPRRRRNRRNRKGRTRKPKNGTNNGNTTNLPVNDVMRACVDNDSINRSIPLSPLDETTPPRTPSPQVDTSKPTESELALIKTTPVNKKRSLHRPDGKNDSLNVTNLNFLFESNFVYSNPRSDSDICIDKNVSPKKRSKSSVAKLHSPTKESPLPLSQSTQTDLDTETPPEFSLRKYSEVVETPKVSKVLLLEEIQSDKVCDSPILNNHRQKNDRTNNSNKSLRFYDGEVNINPYLNNNEVKIVRRDNSFGEISFFSPNLFQHKSSSTPIEQLHKSNNLVEYIKDSLIKDNVNNCSFNTGNVDLTNNPNSPGTPNLNSNLNISSTSLSEKVLNKEGCLKNVQIHMLNVSKRRSYKTSPKSRFLTQSRVFNRSQSFTYSRCNISRRSSTDGMSESLRQNRMGIGEKLLARLKRYTQVSQKWSVKVLELCSQLGIQLRKSLSSVCNIYNEQSMLESPEKPKCRCGEYRQEISNLNSKIEELTKEVRIVKLQMEELKNNKQSIEMLNQELNKVREELTQFTELRSELEALKQQFKCAKSPSAAPPPPPCVPPPPPPAPPPPPPPPPMMTPSLKSATNPIKIKKKPKIGDSCSDHSRPVISLDDILKVKLKKASDRSGLNTPTMRRSSQPMVSMDMLRQVKLRPASRPSLRPETPDVESPILTTSPHSSLCRLLINDGSMFRLKRLRKVGGYSFDSVSRRSVTGKRERDGS